MEPSDLCPDLERKPAEGARLSRPSSAQSLIGPTSVKGWPDVSDTGRNLSSMPRPSGSHLMAAPGDGTRVRSGRARRAARVASAGPSPIPPDPAPSSVPPPHGGQEPTGAGPGIHAGRARRNPGSIRGQRGGPWISYAPPSCGKPSPGTVTSASHGAHKSVTRSADDPLVGQQKASRWTCPGGT
jgi:hypothetical protein